MTIQFQCQGCRQPFAVPESMAGTQARCNSCGTIITIPRPPQSRPTYTATPQIAAGTFQTNFNKPRQPAISPRTLWVSLGLAATLLVVFGILWFGLATFRNSLNKRSPEYAESGGARPDQTSTSQTGNPFLTVTPPSAPAASGTTNPPTTSPADDTSNPFREVTSPSEGTGTSGVVNPPTIPPAADITPSTSQAPSFPAANSVGSGDSKLPIGNPPRRPTLPLTTVPQTTSGPPSSYASGWNVIPDPPTQPMDVRKGSLSIPMSSWSDVLFPTAPSNFVLISGRENDLWINQVFDLRTGKPVGAPVNEELQFRDASFNGRYFACQSFRGTNRPVLVWSFAKGAMVLEVPTDAMKFGVQPFLAGAHQLIVVGKSFDERPVEVWDLQESRRTQTLSLAGRERILDDSLRVSHSGKYLAMLTRKTLDCYEFATGGLAGQVELPEEMSRCEGVAFSHDGELLAAMCNTDRRHLLVFNLRNGRLQLHQRFEQNEHFSSDAMVLDWLPDGSGLFYHGQQILDASTGKVVWTFPRPDSGCRILGTDRVVTVLDDRRARRKVLTTVSLPQKDILKGFESIQAGGLAVDAALPPLTTANSFGAKSVALPNGFVAWNSVLDPSPTLKRATNRDVKIAGESETISQIRFAGSDTAKVVVQKKLRGRVNNETNLIERVDLNNGQGSGALPLPATYRLLDISPSGDFALVGFVQQQASFDRIDLLGFSPKKHLAGWRPFAGETGQLQDDKHYAFRKLDPKVATWVAFINDQQVATVSGTGKLVVWKVPECEAAYFFENFGEPLAISPGRKYLAGIHEGEFRIFEAATGACRGDLESPKVGLKPLRAAFSQDGQKLAAIIDGGLDRMLVIWNLQTGKLETEFPIHPDTILQYSTFVWNEWQGANLGLEWRGDRYLMLDDRYLIDLTNKSVTWRYHITNSFIAAGSPDGKTWLAGPREDSPFGTKFLNGIATPTPANLRLTVQKSLERQLVIGPGSHVRLAVHTSSVGLQGLEGTVTRAITDGLAARRITIDPQAKLTMSLSTRQEATGDKMVVSNSFSPFFRPRPGDVVFDHQRMVCTLAVTNSSNEVLWKSETFVEMKSQWRVNRDTAQAQAQQSMEKDFRDLLSSGRFTTNGFPQYIFGPLDSVLAGESTLSVRGEGPPPAKQKDAGVGKSLPGFSIP